VKHQLTYKVPKTNAENCNQDEFGKGFFLCGAPGETTAQPPLSKTRAPGGTWVGAKKATDLFETKLQKIEKLRSCTNVKKLCANFVDDVWPL